MHSQSTAPARRAIRRQQWRTFREALLCGVLAAAMFAVGCHRGKGMTSKANDLHDKAYSDPERTAQRAVEEIIQLQQRMEAPRIDDHEVFAKFHSDYFWDRYALAMCQNYMTIGSCNAQMGAWIAAEDAYLKSIEAANKWVGYHIQFVTNTSPEIYRTVKAYFRAKKIEVVAYLKLREIARKNGNEALAIVYDLKSRYAKLYLDSLVALGEANAVVNYETQSYVQDDDMFLTDMETGFKIIVVLLIMIFAYKFAKRMMSKVAATVLGIQAFALIIAHHNTMHSEIKLRTLSVGVGSITRFVEQVRQLPDLSNIPTFDEFRMSIERAKEAAEAGDDLAAAEAYLESYQKLDQLEGELLALQSKYREENPPAGPGGVSAPEDTGIPDRLSGNDPNAAEELLAEEDGDGDDTDSEDTDSDATEPEDSGD